MKTWFVSILHRPLEGGYYDASRTASLFDSEAAAKRFAALALTRGAQVEAGTLPGVVPKMQILRQNATEWARPFSAASGEGVGRNPVGA